MYPAISTLRTVDFEDTALNNKVLAEDGFSARPPVHVTVLAPTGIVPPAVNVKTFPLSPAALLLIVTLEDTHTGDPFGTQIDALAVIFIQSFDKRASVTPIENTTAVGATPAFKLPVAVTDELHVNALVVVYPTCPAIEVTDFEDTALNVTVVDDDGFAAKNAPEHVIVIAPAAMPALPTVIVSVVVVSVELALIAFAIPAMLHVGAFAGAKTAVEAVIVTESALISASLTPMWNCIWVIISPAKRLSLMVGALDHTRDEIVVYPIVSTLGIIDFENTAVKWTIVADVGFGASPPVHVNIVTPDAIVLVANSVSA